MYSFGVMHTDKHANRSDYNILNPFFSGGEGKHNIYGHKTTPQQL